jgi:hypothetical protein
MPAVIRRNAPRFASFALVALATFAFAVLAHAGVDPADAGAAAAAGAALASAPVPELPANAHDASVFIGIAASLGVVLRVVVIPLLKSSLFGAFFSKVPLLMQHLILGVLSALCGAAQAYGQGQGVIAAITAAGLAYAASQASFGATANIVEFRAPKP